MLERNRHIAWAARRLRTTSQRLWRIIVRYYTITFRYKDLMNSHSSLSSDYRSTCGTRSNKFVSLVSTHLSCVLSSPDRELLCAKIDATRPSTLNIHDVQMEHESNSATNGCCIWWSLDMRILWQHRSHDVKLTEDKNHLRLQVQKSVKIRWLKTCCPC